MRMAALAVVVVEGCRSEGKAGVVWEALLMFVAGAAAQRGRSCRSWGK
ncbi:hypothetical protein TIFTF001_006109 [Ficus carica]|uniref:Uncharacterized protein n=1 Tax=Ficus carica TaxID=3494 RepID=A0AA88A3G1_FICCA|nr:hypothetical protein TIFTF001_006109 [Ficus carica]